MGRHDAIIVLLRRFVDNPDVEQRWEGIGFAATPQDAGDLVERRVDGLGAPLRLKWGDLLLAMAVERFNPMTLPAEANSIAVVSKKGRVVFSRGLDRDAIPPWQGTWIEHWESHDALADRMLKIASLSADTAGVVAQRRLVLASRACAIEALARFRGDAAVMREALELIRRWAIGTAQRSDMDDVLPALDQACVSKDADERHVARATRLTVTAIDNAREAEWAVYNAAKMWPATAGDLPFDGLRALSQTVRDVMPLSVVMLSHLANEAYPIHWRTTVG